MSGVSRVQETITDHPSFPDRESDITVSVMCEYLKRQGIPREASIVDQSLEGSERGRFIDQTRTTEITWNDLSFHIIERGPDAHRGRVTEGRVTVHVNGR